MKIYVVSEGYDEMAGGAIALHRFCHLLNEIDGIEARLISHKMILKRSWIARLLYIFSLCRIRKHWRVNANWSGRYLSALRTISLMWSHVGDDSVVVYPENISGNPLKAKNVVRWFLHNPGHFTSGVYEYGSGELYFKYSTTFANDFKVVGSSRLSNTILTISSHPHVYCLDGAATERKGVAYLIRKGVGKQFVHDSTDSVCIDGMPHAEVAAVFKRVATFVSYDPVTMFSTYAILCGCRSVIVLTDEERQKYDYNPTTSVLCDGIDDFSKFTRENYERVRAEIDQADALSRKLTLQFVVEVQEYFHLNTYISRSAL